MIDFNDYKFIKKSKSELAADKIMSDICRKLWDEQSYATVYYLGAIAQLKTMVKNMKDTTSFTKKDLLMIIASVKNCPEAPDEIKNLADDILEEFEHKEND